MTGGTIHVWNFAIDARFWATGSQIRRYQFSMLFALPNDDALYQALVDRDPQFDGRVFVCVSSTGIFCRLTCPARKPLRKNCSFRETAADCVAVGYRPCKRCHPVNGLEPVAETLLAALEQEPSRRWRETDLIAMGLDASTVRRVFKRQFGMTFLDIARQRRLKAAAATLTTGAPMIEAQLDAGFESASAFRTAFVRMMGVSPGQMKDNALLRADFIETKLGHMIAVSDAQRLHLLEFVDRKALPTELKRLWAATKGNLGFGRFGPTDQIEAELSNYFNANLTALATPIYMHGTPFYQQVWEALRHMSVGSTQSYSDLAKAIGRPSAVRAVAQANGANQIAIVIPCHRIIGADGSLTGYGGGLWRKQELIRLETEIATKHASELGRSAL